MSESILIWGAYAAFVPLAILAFALLDARVAAVVLYLGGWLLLPVAHYPHDTLTKSYFTVDVIGAGLPSNLGLTKAVVVPLTTLAAWIVLRVRRFDWSELAWLDAVMGAFCLWPLAGALFGGADAAGAGHDALYLSASWGASWALARGLFRAPEDWFLLLRGAAWSGVALLPVALVEGIRGPWLYTAIWGEHAFLLEGAARTIGNRPLGLLEHGNQYALWLACGAFAWLALARLEGLKRWQWALAIATIVAVLVSQSIGAIVLMTAGALASLVPPNLLRRTALVGGAPIALLGAIYLSGLVPAERIARTAAFQPQVVARFAPVRLKSLLYRIRRDQMAIPLLRKAPLTGTAHWDWWRPLGSHPWGLPLLLAGQFGVISVLLLLIALLTPAVMALFRDGRRGVLCATLVLIAAADALFNSFVYFPAVLFAAALVGRRPVSDRFTPLLASRDARRARFAAVDNRPSPLPMPDDPA